MIVFLSSTPLAYFLNVFPGCYAPWRLHCAKAAKSFCCSLLAATLSTLNILYKNVYINSSLKFEYMAMRP